MPETAECCNSGIAVETVADESGFMLKQVSSKPNSATKTETAPNLRNEIPREIRKESCKNVGRIRNEPVNGICVGEWKRNG